MFDDVRKVVWRVCKEESSHRAVDPNPAAWSDWFINYASVVSRPAWFKFDGPSWRPLTMS
jgi:hypothetical protein